MGDRGVAMSAPGKVNLILRVLDRRPDTYHNLWSVMQAIELADELIAEQDGASRGIRLTCEGADLPAGPGNLAYQAAERVLARLGRRDGIRLVLRKRLPLAAGLGGGSSDAAATIQALAMLFETGWSRVQMAELGQTIGSDVPFFFYGGTALVEGRGERVTPLQLQGEGWLLLVHPGFSISTAGAYARLADSRRTGRTEMGGGGSSRIPQAPALPWSTRADEEPAVVAWEKLVASLENDFGPVMELEHPILRDIRLLLLDRGARAALLAGSGSTVFGVFSSEAEATEAAAGIKGHSEWRLWVTRTGPGLRQQASFH